MVSTIPIYDLSSTSKESVIILHFSDKRRKTETCYKGQVHSLNPVTKDLIHL